MTATENEPREEFWTRYNRRFEFPLSAAMAVLLHTIAGGLVILTLAHLMSGSSKDSGVEVQLVPDLGFDDDGEGSTGSGGEEPKFEKDGNPLRAPVATQPNPVDLPTVKEPRPVINNPAGPEPIPQLGADYRELDETLRKKLFDNQGDKTGEGPQTGRGIGGEKGAGPGGSGKDTSRERSLRWVLRFTTTDGRDYLNQLAAMGAEVVVPLSADNKQAIIFTDLKDPSKRRPATDEDLKRLAGMVRFYDSREDSVKGVVVELKPGGKPTSFFAFFPKLIEEELSRKELGYRNRRPEDIEETIFRIRVRDGKGQIEVVDQRIKR
jgi:hypothetical protein